MMKVLFVCNEGMSTSVLAKKVSDYSVEIGNPIEIDARPESQVIKIYKEYDLLMLAPQLAFLQGKMKKRTDNEIRIGKLNAVDFARMNIPKLYDAIVKEINELN